MNTHCLICGEKLYANGRFPITGDNRFCDQCAARLCEEFLERREKKQYVVTEPGDGDSNQ